MKNRTNYQRPVGDESRRFCGTLRVAVTQVKKKLISRYEKIAPARSGLIRHAADVAETQAWETPFPHLLFPDIAELRLAEIVADAAPVQRA